GYIPLPGKVPNMASSTGGWSPWHVPKCRKVSHRCAEGFIHRPVWKYVLAEVVDPRVDIGERRFGRTGNCVNGGRNQGHNQESPREYTEHAVHEGTSISEDMGRQYHRPRSRASIRSERLVGPVAASRDSLFE